MAENHPLQDRDTILEAATAAGVSGHWMPTVFWIWFGGAVVLGARIVCGSLRLSRRIRGKPAVADRRILELLEESRRQMGIRKSPIVVETYLVDSPALFGLFRPRLLLPAGLTRRLDAAELRHVLLHELAYLRRHDLHLNWQLF